MSLPRGASSQRDKEAGKRRESEGGQLFFFPPLLLNASFFFDFKDNPPARGLSTNYDNRRSQGELFFFFLKAWLFHHALSFLGHDEETK